MADFFQSFPVAGQDLTTPKGRQVVQDALDALYDLIQRVQSASALDLRGKLTLRSGRGDAPLDGDSGAGLMIEPVDEVIADAAGTGKTMLTGFDLKVMVARALEELVEEDRVTTTRVRITEREDCDGRLELLDCDKETRASIGTDATLRVADQGADAAVAGMPGYVVVGDAFYGQQADGTRVPLGGGSGLAHGTPQSYFPSNAYHSYYTTSGETIRDVAWGPWGGARITDNFSFFKWTGSAKDVTASGGRTFTFAAGSWVGPLGPSGTLTASSGSFVTDGWAIGDQVRITGTASNDGDVLLTAVSASVLTFRRLSAGAAEGPLAATARIRPLIIPYLGRDYAGSVQRDNWTWGLSLDDGSAFVLWDSAVVVQQVLTTGVSLDLFVRGLTASGYVGGSWGGDQLSIELIAYDPSDGTTEITASRNVTTDDSAYTTLTIPASDLTDFTPGRQIRLALRATPGTYLGATGSAQVQMANLRAS